MNRIEELEKEVKLLKEILELRQKLERYEKTTVQVSLEEALKGLKLPTPNLNRKPDWHTRVGDTISSEQFLVNNDIVYYKDNIASYDNCPR